MKLFHIFIIMFITLLSYIDVSAYVSSTHPICTWNPGCFTPCSSWSASHVSWSTLYCYDYCGLDAYYNGSSCIAVGDGYYSPSSNDTRFTCNNKPWNNAAYNYYYTSDWNGTNSCSFAATALCWTDYYSSNGTNNISVGTWYYSSNWSCSRLSCSNKPANTAANTYTYTGDGWWTNNCPYSTSSNCWTDQYASGWSCVNVGTWNYSPSWDNAIYSCTNKPSNNSSRNYYYTNDGNGSNSCPYTYSERCWTDLYESVNGTCSGVGIWRYSPNNNNSRLSCTGLWSDTASRNYYWTSDGNGSNSCGQTYADLCGTDLYESVNGTCSAVGVWNYSTNPHNTRFNCTGLPSNAYWTSDWNWSNSCNFDCNAGWSKSGGSCIDTTNPTAWTITYSPNGWTNGNVTVTASCSDSQSGCSSPTFSTTRTSNGAGTLYVYDNAWNNAGRGYNVTNIDKTAPTWTVTYSPSGWTNGNVTVTIICSDSASGCNMVWIATWSRSWNNYSKTFTSNTSSSITIRDNVGNTRSVTYTVSNIDKTGPSVSADNASTTWENSLLPITLSIIDWGWSGITIKKYRWNNSNCWSWINFNNGQVINAPWQWTNVLYLCARDTAWTNNTWSWTYKYDSVIPTNTDNYAYDNVWNNIWTTITLNRADAAPSSGISSTRYCWGATCNPASWTVWTSIPATWQIDNTLRYQTWDIAWNASAIWSIAVKVDTTNPTISANNASTAIWRSNMWMNITLSVSDSGWSGISYRKYIWDWTDATCRSSGTTFTDGQNITSVTIPWNDQWEHTLFLCTRDVAWNNNSWNGIYKFDKDSPTISDNYIPDDIWTNVGTTITLTPIDPNASSANSFSQIWSTRYCWGVTCNVAAWTLTSGPWVTNIPVTADLEDTLRYQTWDNAWNASAIWEIIVKIEDNLPDTTMSFNRLWSATVYSPDSRVNYNVRWVINCTDANTPSSWCDNSTRQYRVQTTAFSTCDLTGTWTNYNGTGIDITEIAWNESVRYICSRVRDIATNGYAYSPVYTVRIDMDTPEFGDLTTTLPVPNDWSKLLADIHNVIITAVRDWWAPITLIEWQFENYSTTNSYWPVLQSTSDLNSWSWEILSINANMTNVDRNRDADWYRQYSFKITKVRDEAGNEITDSLTWVWLPNILYYVFANASDLSWGLWSYDVTTNELNLATNVADGSNKDLVIILKDTYGNKIVPASDINREIDFNFNVSNNLALNQFNWGWDAVYLDTPTNPWVFNDRLSSNGLFTHRSTDSAPSTDGSYKYTFKVYTPTYLSGATDGRQWANGDMTIHNIDYNIRQTAPAYIWTSYSWTVIDSNIDFLFKPLYQAMFTWDLSLWIFADTVQSAILNITSANATTISNSFIRLWFGQTNGASNNVVHPNYNLIYNPNATTPVTIAEWHQWGNINSLHNLWTLPGNKTFDVKITQESWPVDTTLPTYVSSHIQYDIDGKTVAYDSNTIGKDRYVHGTNLVNTSQVWLKVMWRIQSKNQTDLTTGQSWTDLYALWDNSKANLRELIRKQATLEIKNVAWATSWIVTDLTGNTWSVSNGWTRLRKNTILYYDLVPGTNLQIWNGVDLVASWVKTIIARWWNVYMKNNITYSDNSSDMLWIISLTDNAWNGWNIYLDTQVTNLVGIYYADKAMISYDGVNEIDWSVWTTILKNQFYLYGTLFSENTIWGSIIPKCPYYVPNALCDTNEARKYDLNFLRRYFTYDNNDVDTLENNIYNSGIWYFSYGNPNFKYPMVIEYNSNIQSTPPPLFENEQF